MQFAWAALLLASAAAGARVARRNAPDVDAKVTAQARENIQIHDEFLGQEKKDEQEQAEIRHNKELSAAALKTGRWVVALDRDLRTQMLVQVRANATQTGIKDPCGSITCAASLVCPGTFKVESLPGHCCPYCVNPDVKLESVVTGATGGSGGTESVFCENVWCFPTMCTKALAEPSTTNGNCCATCPAL